MVKIFANVQNSHDYHNVVLGTGSHEQSITIPSKTGGFGSSANGAELLFLALATCYCNDIYREAQARNIVVKSVIVEVQGDFDGISGHSIENIVYSATVDADASEDAILELMRHTDTVAEIQNTLRQANRVEMTQMKAISSKGL
jgi:uncharacterized OsmC-like protein